MKLACLCILLSASVLAVHGYASAQAVIDTPITTSLFYPPEALPCFLLITKTGAVHSTVGPAISASDMFLFTITNYGNITSNTIGFELQRGDYAIHNENTGHISGDLYGIHLIGVARGLIYNSGTISGKTGIMIDTGAGDVDGAPLAGQQSIRIYNSGTITGEIGIVAAGGNNVSIFNRGTIIGTGGMAIFLGSGDSSVELQNGSRVVGNILSTGTGNRFIVNAPSRWIDYGYHISGFDSAAIKAGTFNLNGSLSSRDMLISGAGALIGNGVVILAGGSLHNHGTLGVRIVQLQGGTLYNHGLLKSPYIFNGTVENHGLLAAGNSIGTLRIAGDYFQAPDGTLEVEFDRQGSDRYVIQGRARLAGGTLRLMPCNAPRRWNGTIAYPFLVAEGGVEGAFSDVNLPDYYRAALDYGSAGVTLLVGRLPYADRAACGENRGLMQALDGLYDTATGEVLNLTNELDNHVWAGETICPLVSGLHPTGRGVLPRLVADEARDRLAGFTRRLIPKAAAPDAASRATGGWSANAWATGTLKHRNGREGRSGYQASAWGLNLSLDRDLGENGVLGVGFGAAGTHAKIDATGRWHEASGGQGVVYGRQALGNAWISAAAAFGRHAFTRRDRMEAGSWARSVVDISGAWSLGLMAESGYRIDLGGFQIRPRVGVSRVELFEDEAVGRGAGNAGFRHEARTWQSFRGLASLEVSRAWSLSGGLNVTPSISAGWEHDFTPGQGDYSVRFRAGRPEFDLIAESWPSDVYRLGGGISIGRSGQWAGYARYEAEQDADGCGHAVDAGLRLRF